MKSKRFILIACAVVFLVAVFIFKNYSDKKEEPQQATGLVYTGNETISEIVVMDSDGDSIADWEEVLWGTDPYKKDTDQDGKDDSVDIAELKSDTKTAPIKEEDLTETDKFSRELFSTVAALSQGGELDSATVQKISESLASELENRAPTKIYTLAEIKTSSDVSKAAIEKYYYELNNLFSKNKVDYEQILTIVQNSFDQEGEVVEKNELSKLSTSVTRLNNVVKGMLTMKVPTNMSLLHIRVVNVFQALSENIEMMQKNENDPILVISGINNYLNNIDNLITTTDQLLNSINEKVK